MSITGEQMTHLQQIIYDTIPLSRAMMLQISHVDANAIKVTAPVATANANIHNTAFAGSIYSICALSAWALLHNRLMQENVPAEVVLAQADIRYLLPIKENINASCSIEEDDYQSFYEHLQNHGKASISVVVRAQEQEEIQATLDARVAVKLVS
jgi:thioesterase domain-containing protein